MKYSPMHQHFSDRLLLDCTLSFPSLTHFPTASLKYIHFSTNMQRFFCFVYFFAASRWTGKNFVLHGKEKKYNMKEREREKRWIIEYSRKLALKLCMHLKLELNFCSCVFFPLHIFINICLWMQFDWNVNSLNVLEISIPNWIDPMVIPFEEKKKQPIDKKMFHFKVQNGFCMMCVYVFSLSFQ